VIHLSCHSNTKGDIENLHYVNVGGPNGKIYLGDLKKQLRTPEGISAETPRPFVFLNACGSSVPQLAEHASFAEFMLKEQFRGVLGTMCDISDVVAAHFAAVFYEALLGGKTVGEAMHEARWHLMARHRNPLGLLYTFHGNVDLKVTCSRAGDLPPACESAVPAR
jgi:hypothetical protein